MEGKCEAEETAPKALASSSRDDGSGRGYDVFLNFSGFDSRLTIVDCLYEDMKRVGIRAFKDSELHFGKEIEGGLWQAINDSRIYIPIFSPNYASSKWCLLELARIVEEWKDNDEKVILPIFYNVDVADVKLNTALYRKDLQKHESDFGKDSAKQWEEALREVARISGRKLEDHGLDELKSLTVKEASSLLWKRQTDVPDQLVGIRGPMDRIMEKLDLGAFDVRYIVIHGMGGIGKTTLAEVVFRQISPHFKDHCCFLKDVRTRDILDLQKKLLSGILNLSCTNLSDIEVSDWIKTRFQGMKVIVVLDDIDKWGQIMRLAGEPNWFGIGSRIIITTRNIEFLVNEGDDNNVLPSRSGQYSFYDMPEMNSCDALQLFCERALGCAEPPPDYIDISKKLVKALGQLPLALDVVGSTLRGECLNTWENYLIKLKKVMNMDVKEKLMISYEALEPKQQKIFLDIACFFINQEKTTAIKYWDECFGYPTEIDVKILTRMSLIKIIGNDKLWMHDQLRDLGRDIVDPESGKNDQSGSRFWSPEVAIHVVRGKKGTEKIVALNLGTATPDVMYRFKCKEFVRLDNLTFLRLDHGNFEGDFQGNFYELRWLSWSNCPSEFRATNFGLENLVILELSGNNISEDWGGWREIMVAKRLKVLKLMDCSSLKKTPKFSAISKLEILILIRCDKLSMIDESIGKLKHLAQLKIDRIVIESLPESIGGLTSLTELRIVSNRISMLPRSIGNLVKLKHLILTCVKLRKLPDSIGELESLLELDVKFTNIIELPYSIGKLKRLKIFKIPGYLEIRNSIERLEPLVENLKLPDSIGKLQSLVELDLSFSRIRILPDCIGDLKKLKVLKLDFCFLSELPKSIGMLKNLEELHPHANLKGEIPSEIGALSSLKILDLSHSHISGLPTTINRLTNLHTLRLSVCHSIQRLPELPKSLMWLSFSSNSLTTIPDFSNLTNLVDLFLVGTSVQEPNTEGLVRLRALRKLTLRVGKNALPPTDFSSLSQLQELCVSCADSRSLTRLPSSLRELALEDVQSPIDWSVFSNLENLSRLSIQGYSLGEIQFEALGQLPKFNELNMSHCPLLRRLPVLPCLKEIKRLFLYELPQLIEIKGLGELKSLRELRIWNCDSIKSLNESDPSNLHNLTILEIENCESLESVPGVPKSCELEVYGCPRFNGDGEGSGTTF